MDDDYFFYRGTLTNPAASMDEPLPAGYCLVTWEPSIGNLFPAPLARTRREGDTLHLRHLVFFWLQHFLSPFARTREYTVLMVLSGNQLAHYSLVRSRDFRFPFMDSGDIQVGPVWTHPAHRGKGLASRVLKVILTRWNGNLPHRHIWWVCLKNNFSSVAVARKNHLIIAGEGYRRKRLGLRLFGGFVVRGDAKRMFRRGGPDFTVVSEVPGLGATEEQISILYTRYDLASRYARGRNVLEVACGPGLGLGLLAARGARVTAGDLDPGILDMAVTAYAGRPDVRLARFDAQAIPFADACFDVIAMFEALYYLPDPNAFLREAQRVLRPGGYLLISSVNRLWTGFHRSAFSRKYYNVEELRAILCSHGFAASLYGGFPEKSSGVFSRTTGILRRGASELNLIPRSMKSKAFIKRLLYGRLIPIPSEVKDGMAPAEPMVEIATVHQSKEYKFLYAVAVKAEAKSA